MFVTEIFSEREKILQQLQSSPFQFHLTGSRFFGGYDALSDYDFFVMNEPGRLDPFLEQAGFFCSNNENYTDSSIEAIYKHPCEIDIQIIEPDFMMAKIFAQEEIKMWLCWPQVKEAWKTLSKEFKSRIWDRYIEIYQKHL